MNQIIKSIHIELMFILIEVNLGKENLRVHIGLMHSNQRKLRYLDLIIKLMQSNEQNNQINTIH